MSITRSQKYLVTLLLLSTTPGTIPSPKGRLAWWAPTRMEILSRRRFFHLLSWHCVPAFWGRRFEVLRWVSLKRRKRLEVTRSTLLRLHLSSLHKSFMFNLPKKSPVLVHIVKTHYKVQSIHQSTCNYNQMTKVKNTFSNLKEQKIEGS